MKIITPVRWVVLLCLLNIAPTFAADAAPKSQRPNILFAIADDASWKYFSAYGCKWLHTPAFDRVAKGGILFTRAYTPNAKCAPSRACILTGRNSWQLEAAANHWCYFPTKFRTYAEALEDAGYFVGYTGKPWAPGVAKTADGKPRYITGTPFNRYRVHPPASGIAPTDYARNFDDFLQHAPKDKPWCFWYGGHEPHRGYEYESGIKKGHMKISDIDKVPPFWPDTPVVRTDMLDYAYELEYFDKHLGRMLDELAQRGELDNTLIVVTADNGMPFPRIKGQEYEMSNHLPLAIMWPDGIKHPGRQVDDFISFIDFAPTFIQVAGVKWADTGLMPSPGHSLVDIFQSDKSGWIDKWRDHVLIGKERHDVGRPHDEGYPIRGIVTDQYIYLHNYKTDRWPAGNPEAGYLNCDGSPTKTLILDLRRKGLSTQFWQWSFGKRESQQLFKRSDDPMCMTDLADNPADAKVKDQLEKQMTDELKQQKDPRMSGNGDVFDHYPYADTRDKDFYERYMAGEKLPTGWVNKSDFEKAPIK